MKQLIFILLLTLFPVMAIGQTVINLDKTYIDSTWQSLDVDTLYLAKDTIYLTASGDTLYITSTSEVHVTGSLEPSTDKGHDLGGPGNYWHGTYTDDLYVSDSAAIDTCVVFGEFYLTDLASDNLVLLSIGSDGEGDSTETVDASTITFDTLTFDFGDVTNDLDIGDTIEFDNGAQIHNEETDTIKIIETVTKIEGDLHVTGHVTSEKSGGLAYVSTPGTQTINTGGTFEKLDEGAIAYTSAHLYNFTHNDGRLTYTGTPTIHVTITVALAAESGETSQVTNFRIAKDGTTIAATDMPITFTALDFAANTPLKWLDEVATNSYYEIFGTSDTDADEFDINTLVFTIIEH